jgi:hypothetical protein
MNRFVRRTVPLAAALLLLATACGPSHDSTSTTPPPPSTYRLTLTKDGTGTGTVQGTGGLACGTACGTTSADFAADARVTLTASAAVDSTLGQWIGCDTVSGASCTVTMGGPRQVTAVFEGANGTDFTLTVIKDGTGTGTVSGTGLSCGTGCATTSATYPSGTSVTLTATAASGSSFGSWSGCGSTSGASCTVTMTAARRVTATFDPVPAALSTLQVNKVGQGTVTGGGISCGTTCSVDLAPLTRVGLGAAPASGWVFGSWAGCDSVVGTTCQVTMGKAARTVTVTFAAAPVATLRVRNDSQYPMIDLRLNKVQQFQTGQGIASGATADFTFSSGGAVTVEAGVGYYESSGARSVWFTYGTTATVALGQTTSWTAQAITVQQLLSSFSASRNWDGPYYCTSCPTFANLARFTFTSAGGWTLRDNGAVVGSGSVTQVSFPRDAAIVTFRLCATCADIQLGFPFSSFKYRNGPPDWPIIEYVRQ